MLGKARFRPVLDVTGAHQGPKADVHHLGQAFGSRAILRTRFLFEPELPIARRRPLRRRHRKTP